VSLVSLFVIGLVPVALSQNFLIISFGKKTFVKSAPCIFTFSNWVLYAKESSKLVFDKSVPSKTAESKVTSLKLELLKLVSFYFAP